MTNHKVTSAIGTLGHIIEVAVIEISRGYIIRFIPIGSKWPGRSELLRSKVKYCTAIVIYKGAVHPIRRNERLLLDM